MIFSVFILLMSGLIVFYLKKYRGTGDRAHLKSVSTLVFVIAFPIAMKGATMAVLYPGRAILVYAPLFLGFLIGGGLLFYASRGWGKASALVQAFVYLFAVSFLASCMNYFHVPVEYSHSIALINREVPASAEISELGADKRAAVALELRDALENTDKYVRIGALLKLKELGAAAAPALDKIITLLYAGDQTSQRRIIEVLKAIGPQAAEPLKRVLSGGGKNAVRGAADVIAGLGPAAETAVPELIALLADKDVEIRVKAIRTLGTIGASRKQEILPALAPFAASKDPSESYALSEALKALGAESSQWQGYVAAYRAN